MALAPATVQRMLLGPLRHRSSGIDKETADKLARSVACPVLSDCRFVRTASNPQRF